MGTISAPAEWRVNLTEWRPWTVIDFTREGADLSRRHRGSAHRQERSADGRDQSAHPRVLTACPPLPSGEGERRPGCRFPSPEGRGDQRGEDQDKGAGIKGVRTNT